jgi:hypothetical protein
MAGIFRLRTPCDLLAKLRREYERLQKRPRDEDTAFNFFVTAEHMLDWLYPGKKNKAKREAARKAEVLLQVGHHVANGAKHFDNLYGHHQSVERSDGLVAVVRPDDPSAPPPTPPSPLPSGVVVVPRSAAVEVHIGLRLTGAAAAEFGESVTALDLAQRVLTYWEAHPDLA